MSSEFEFVAKEDENLKSQALDQFREWIAKHPKIKKCRTDDTFLLRFLRTKKFSVPRACEQLEKYMSIRKIYPHLFEYFDYDSAEFKNIFGLKGGFVLRQSDPKGRLVMYIDVSRFDGNNCKIIDLMKIINMFYERVGLDERSQTKGVVQVYNCHNAKLSYLSLWTPTRLKEFSECWQMGFPIRYQSIYVVNLPLFGRSFLQLLMNFLSEKLKSRIRVRLQNIKHSSLLIYLFLFLDC